MPRTTTTPRGRVVEALTTAAERFPRLGPMPLDTRQLSPRDAALALAIHRTCMQRWLTIEHLIDRFSHQPTAELEPAMRAVLLSGGAQLLFFDRLPDHAVVDESVKLARVMIRPGAGGMVNAVLRKLAQLIDSRTASARWSPAADRLPTENGYILLRQPALPAADDLPAHLSVATSHPRDLINRWAANFGIDRAAMFCRHGLRNPPTIVCTEQGNITWQATHGELVAFLDQDPRRRVQDPTAGLPAQATADLRPQIIIDYCAGLGTKTRQLAQAHPQAQVWATDTDAARLAELGRIFANHPQVKVARIDALPPADLVLLDVPCTNTGVLSRRPEARYRFTGDDLARVARLQQSIFNAARPLLKPAGHLLYATCSLEPEENHHQSARFATAGLTLIKERFTPPAEPAADYHDGGYFVLCQSVKK